MCFCNMFYCWQNFWRISNVLGTYSAWQKWKLSKRSRVKTNKLGHVCRAWRTSDPFTMLSSAYVRFMDSFARENNTPFCLYVPYHFLHNPQCFSVTSLSNRFTTNLNNCAVPFEICSRWKLQEDEEEDVRSYWMTLRTGEDTLIWKR
jgi:hypothetical protein